MLDKKLYSLREITEMDQLWHSERDLSRGPEYKWIFRGQRCHDEPNDFDLMPSLERTVRDFAEDAGQALRNMPCIECWSLREFKRRLHHYVPHVPEDNDKLEWLALMQHYGAPTRLLDWTYSFFVAAFFAVEASHRCNSEIWALNANYFGADSVIPPVDLKEIKDSIVCTNDPTLKDKDRSIRMQNEIISYLWRERRRCVSAVNPLRLNERLTIQQGVFLFPGDITTSFEENLGASPYSEKSNENLLRFRIDKGLRTEILEWLYQCNISRATLFPGLDGYAQSFNTRLGFVPDKISRDLRCGSLDDPGVSAPCCGRSAA